MPTSSLTAALERTGAHDHLCSIYERPEERFAVGMPYLRLGLERGERCLYIANDGELHVVRRELEAAGVDVERSISGGALVLSTQERAYMRQGRFDPQKMLDFWHECAGEALNDGYTVLRATGETDWVAEGGPGLERWMEYESRLTEVLRDCKCLALCQYNRRLFPAELLLGVIRTHPVLIYGATAAQNLHHVLPQDFLQEDHIEREVERQLRVIQDREGAQSALRRQQQTLEAKQDELRHTQKLLAGELAAMTRLHELSTRLTSTRDDARALLMEMLDATIALQGAQFGMIGLRDHVKQTLDIVVQRGFDQGAIDHFLAGRLDATASGRAMLGRQRVVIEDVQAEPGFAEHRAAAQAAGFRAVQATPLVSSSGDVLGIVATYFREPHRPSERELRMTDLHARQAANMVERRRAEQRLRRSEAYLAEGQRISQTGSWAWNPANGAIFWSAEHFRIFGLEPRARAPSHKEMLERVHPDDRPAFVAQFQAAVSSRTEYVMDCRIVRPDGSLRYAQSRARPVLDDSGALTEYVGTIIDTTERTEAQAKLQESERRFRELAEAIPHHVWTYHRDGSIGYHNRRLVDYTGLTEGQLARGGWDSVHPEDAERARAAWAERWAKGGAYEVEQRIRGHDGLYRRFLSRGVPVYGADGEIVEWFGTDTPIEERKLAEEAAQRARDELAHVNRALTVAELTASIAHELNQPLAAVVTNANACERWLAGPAPNVEEAHQGLRRIARDANRASQVIARIRDLLTRRGSQRTELGIAEVVAEVVSIVEGEARAKGVAMTIAVQHGLAPVMADRVQIQQVLLNLLVNAIDAMNAVVGPRTLEVRAEARAAELVVSVRDSGAGLQAKSVERMFEPFFTTKREGMGMGLAISRSIVEAHGGKMRALSNPGAGATFEFTLPFPG